MTAEQVILNLINGNVTDAKRGAKKHSITALKTAATKQCGMPNWRAMLTIEFLKGDLPWQEYCDRDKPTVPTNQQ